MIRTLANIGLLEVKIGNENENVHHKLYFLVCNIFFMLFAKTDTIKRALGLKPCLTLPQRYIVNYFAFYRKTNVVINICKIRH